MDEDDKDPFDIGNLFARADQSPEFDQALEGLTGFFSVIGRMHEKMVACGVPSAMAEKLVFEWLRSIPVGAIFNAPHPHIVVQIGGTP